MTAENKTAADKSVDETMNDLLWKVIDLAGANPASKPDPRIWPHLLCYAPNHIRQRLKALFTTTGKTVEESSQSVVPSAKEEIGVNCKQLIEDLAKKHYETWSNQPGYVPWQEGGNSDKQEEARDIVRSIVHACAPDTGKAYPSDPTNSPTMDSSVENPRRTTAVADAMETLKKAMRSDSDYAWSWHCAIWSCAYDEGLHTAAANRAAARAMKMAFDIDTSIHPNFDKEHLKSTAPA